MQGWVSKVSVLTKIQFLRCCGIFHQKIHRNAHPFPFATYCSRYSFCCFNIHTHSVPFKEEIWPRSKPISLISLLLYSLMRLTLKPQEQVKKGMAKKVIEWTRPSLSDQEDKHKRKKSISISFYSLFDHHPHLT